MPKTVLITGGSDGLGLATAKLLISKGYQVHVIGRDRERLDRAKKELNSPLFSVWQGDLTQFDQVLKVVKQIGRLDVLINNAGIWLEGTLENNTPEQISQVIDTNIKGVIYATKSVLPDFLQQNSGIIVNISSTSGLKGREKEVVYDASKWAVTGFTESLKAELASTKIKVIGFYPGGMNTKFFEKSGSPKENQNWLDTAKVAEVIAFVIGTDPSLNLDHVVLNRFVK